MSTVILTALKSDVPDIANIHLTSWQNTYANTLCSEYLANVAPTERLKTWQERFNKGEQNQHVLLAKHANKTVGFICFYLDQHLEFGSYVDNLHVNSNVQGLGIGKLLLRSAAQIIAEKANHPSMCLIVNQDNKNAQGFYLKQGACNVRPDIWQAPDGTPVPTYWFVWPKVANALN